MNGGDIGSIQLLERHQQPADPQPSLARVHRPRTPVGQHRIRRVGSFTTIHPLQSGQSQLQPLAYPRPQFLGGGIGVSDHQQCLKRMPLLRDQTQAEVSQSKGFAGAGAGFKQAKTRIQRVAIGIETLSHGAILNGLQRLVAGLRC